MRGVRNAATLALALVCTQSFAAGKVLADLTAPSPVLGREIAYRAYLPDPAIGNLSRWPVVYLLHGYGGNEREWFDSGGLAELLDDAIANSTIPPMIAITPFAGTSWYVDNPDPGGAGKIETAFATDLIAEVDRRFPTLACREARLIAGLSMGGSGAMQLGVDHPELYAGVVSLSGRFPRPVTNPSSSELAALRTMYAGAFGRPFDVDRYNANNTYDHVEGLKQRKELPLYIIRVGGSDQPEFIEEAASLQIRFQQANVLSILKIDAGGHDIQTWNSGLISSLRALGGRIEKASCP
jgi:enterochelin esterase family protein